MSTSVQDPNKVHRHSVLRLAHEFYTSSSNVEHALQHEIRRFSPSLSLYIYIYANCHARVEDVSANDVSSLFGVTRIYLLD